MNTEQERCVKCDYCDLEDFFWDGKRLCFIYRCRIFRDTIQKAAVKYPFHFKTKKHTGDMIHHPDHYNFRGMECKDFIEKFVADPKSYYEGNIFKYLYRYLEKNKEEDLNKAMEYTRLLKEYMYGKKD